MMLYLYIIKNINFLLDIENIHQKTPSPDLAFFCWIINLSVYIFVQDGGNKSSKCIDPIAGPNHICG